MFLVNYVNSQNFSGDYMIFKKSELFPSYTGGQIEQFKTQMSYSKFSNFLYSSDEFYFSNEFNISKLNSGIGLNYTYSNSNLYNFYKKEYNLTYNYRIETENVKFIPGIGIKNNISNIQYDNMSSSFSSYFTLNTSFLIKFRNLDINLGLSNFNQPQVITKYNGIDQSYSVPIIYQTCIDYRFLNNYRFIDYINFYTYADFGKFALENQSYYNLDFGLNARVKSIRAGFGLDFTDDNFYMTSNYFIGIEKNNIKLYYIKKSYGRTLTSLSTHNFTLSANFDIFDKKNKD